MSFSNHHISIMLVSLIVATLAGTGQYALSKIEDITNSLTERFEEIEKVNQIEITIMSLNYPYVEFITGYGTDHIKQKTEWQFIQIEQFIDDLTGMDVVNKKNNALILFVKQKLEKIKEISNQIFSLPPKNHAKGMTLLKELSSNHLKPLSKYLRRYRHEEEIQVNVMKNEVQKQGYILTLTAIVFIAIVFTVLGFSLWKHRNVRIKPAMPLH